MSSKLYAEADSVEANKILAVAKLAGVELEHASNHADAQTKSPFNKLPILETSEGTLYETNAIAYYLASAGKASALIGAASPFEAASVAQWTEYAQQEIDLAASVWTYPIQGKIANNAAATAKAKQDVRKAFEQLNKHLATRTYLVGHRVTLADVAVAASLRPLYRLVADQAFRKPFGNVNRWFTTIANQPAVLAAWGATELVEKAQQAPEQHAAAAHAEKPKKEEKPKAEKKADEKPKKEEKPKEEKKPKKKDDDEEEEESYEDDAPKSKNPLDQLPPSKLVMDEWKRMYSNNDGAVALPWLWEHFDAEGYSLWFCRYKYTDELKKVFMTANLVSGWLQRLEKLRKYGFGNVVIFGEDDEAQSIEGAWLVRGTELPAEMTQCDDYELYDWKRVAHTDDAQKQLFADYSNWEGSFAGREQVWGKPAATKVNQGKTFK